MQVAIVHESLSDFAYIYITTQSDFGCQGRALKFDTVSAIRVLFDICSMIDRSLHYGDRYLLKNIAIYVI